MRDEQETQHDDDVADVSAAGEAASATPGTKLGHDPDPELIDAANAAERPPDKE
ncbi:MAG TPA: hypothetical protein VNT54_09305 [Solirubrobacteraceae bacterium]|nr:hypothetical protein [Solirubrobacteraceae bacterium]